MLNILQTIRNFHYTMNYIKCFSRSLVRAANNYAARIIRKIKAIIDELKNEAELAFSMHCDEEMSLACIFTNGEAIYDRTEKRLWQEVKEQNKKTA